MIEIVLRPGEPEYLQIVQQVRWAVANGRLAQGQRLESVRALAQRLHVNASTVARAYRMLELEGVVETHQRGGTLVRPVDSTGMRDLRHLRLRQSMERSLVETLAQGFSLDEIEAAFGLQLAAWRERRTQRPADERPAGNAARLSSFAGSHDLALEALWMQARRSHPGDVFSVRYVGSLDGVLALLHGEVGLAGAHMLDEESGEYNRPILRRLFVGQQLCVVTLAERLQGLLVAPGNPYNIRSLADLVRPNVRFVNRQPGSGTRTLLDYHLHRLNVPARAVNGYDSEAATHTAVADAITRGAADVGLGLAAAARAFGLDFIPLARERYDLVTLADLRRQPPLSWLLDSIGSAAFKSVIATLDGYDTAHTGEESMI